MFEHLFIFSPGVWLGEGKITFKGSPSSLRFYSKWEMGYIPGTSDLLAKQTIEIENVEEKVITHYRFSDKVDSSFIIHLESESIGQVSGKGVVDFKTIAWEFHSAELEGFEVYEKLKNDEYRLHAEFSSIPQYRTTIEGKIWQKTV